MPPHSNSYLQPCDVAVFRSFKSCIQAQASATLARSIFDGSFGDVFLNKVWRRQCSAEWASRATTDLSCKNPVSTIGRRLLRAHSDDFRDAVTEAAALHARNELFVKHVTPAMAEESDDDEDGTQPLVDADEPELIDTPPAPTSTLPMSKLERCIAQRAVYGAGPRRAAEKLPLASHLYISLCCLTCRLSVTYKNEFFFVLPPLLLRNTDQGI